MSAQEETWAQITQAINAGNLSEAEPLLRELCTEYEDAGSPWGGCHLALGSVLARQGGQSKRQEALAQLEIAKDLVTDDKDHYGTNILIANIHLADRRWDQAIAAADEAAQYAGPENAVAIAKVKGQAYYRQDQWQNAATELEKTTESAADASLYAWLGRSYFELGNLDAALPVLTQAVQIDRDNRVGLYFAARIHFTNDNLSEAIALSERAIQTHPQDTNIRNLLGMAYLGDERAAEAEQQFEVVLAEQPNNASAIYNLGQAYLQQQEWARAVEQFQKAQNMFPAGSPNLGRLLYDLGIGFERLARYQDALQAYTDSRAINETTDVLDAIDRVQEQIRRGKGGGGR